MKLIDLRSDTVTKPTPGMREAMANAEVGDDVFGEDPTVNKLQERVASMLGKEAALFVTSGTMGNQIAINCHTRPGDEVVCEANCHSFNYEGGGPAFLSGVQMQPIQGIRGAIMADQIEAVIRPLDHHFPQTRLVALENTHNRAGGAIFPIEEIERIRELVLRRGLKIHLDGARLWNAHIATGIPLDRYARLFDSVSVCLSKGLGAPVGSVLAGSKAFINDAHRYRKIYGGGMRQAGILAAAGLYALDHHLHRLADDHRRALCLAECLASFDGVAVDFEATKTNIVIADFGELIGVSELTAKLRDQGLLAVAFSKSRIRFVTHLDVDDSDIDQAITILKKTIG
jgi:threonine aldolase